MIEVVVIETPGLGDRTYLVHDGAVAAVIDPQRDIDRVLSAADTAGVRITHVAETHVHNDYVSGGLELAELLDAYYLVAGADEVDFQRRAVSDGDLIQIGSFGLQVLATPGHTPHHVSYVVMSDGRQEAVFTGGSLLYGTVGRTDLISDDLSEQLTRAQYRSAHLLASELPGDVAVWPTHGFGSFCSSAKSSGAATSTIGAERRTNMALTIEDEDAFVSGLLAGLTAYPRYYARMAPINRAGPQPVDLSPPAIVDPAELGRRIHVGEWIVDLRERRAYALRHLRGTVSVELGDPFATYLGWVLPWGTPITLIGDTAAQIAQAQRALVRIGIDRPSASAVGTIDDLASGGSISGYPVVDFADMVVERDEGRRPTVLDVRRPDERALGAIEGSFHVPLDELSDHLGDLPTGPLWVHCASGFRASIAASILARAGLDVVLVDDDWQHADELGIPIRIPSGSG